MPKIGRTKKPELKDVQAPKSGASTEVENPTSKELPKSIITNIPLSLIDEPEISIRTNPEVDQLFIESVKQSGIIEPVIVRRKDDGRYERIGGYRRIVAVQEAGLTEIESKVISNLTELQVYELMFQENLHNQPNSMDVAEAATKIMKKFNLTQKKTAKMIRMSEEQLSIILKVYRDEQIRQEVREGLPLSSALEKLRLKSLKGTKSFAGETLPTSRKELREAVHKARENSNVKPRKMRKCSYCDEKTQNLELRSMELCQGCVLNLEAFRHLLLEGAQKLAEQSGSNTTEILKQIIDRALAEINKTLIPSNSASEITLSGDGSGAQK